MTHPLDALYAHFDRHAHENLIAAQQGRAFMAPITGEEMRTHLPAELHELDAAPCWHAWVRSTRHNHVDAHAALIMTQQHRAELLVGVEESARGKGVGSDLARIAINWAKRVGVEWIDGHAMADNAGVLRFDERLGFRVHSIVDDAVRILGTRYAVAHLVMNLRSVNG